MVVVVVVVVVAHLAMVQVYTYCSLWSPTKECRIWAS